MAQIHETRLVDDLDGGKGDETVRFSLDGKAREIDLSAGNAARLREVLAPYVEASRVAASGPVRRRSSSSSGGTASAADKARNAAVREWGRRNGHEVSERGRIGTALVEAHAAANYPATSGTADGEVSPEYRNAA